MSHFKWEVKILVEAQNKVEAQKSVEGICLKVLGVEPYNTTRSLNQNSALHLWFTQIAEEAQNGGLTMDMIVLNPTEVPITPALLKDLFRLIGKQMYKKDSTAKLDKLEFHEIQRTFEKLIAERLEISIPFPSENYE